MMSRAPIDVLRERAQALARRSDGASTAGLPLSLFERGGQLFGVRLEEMAAAEQLRDLVPIPGALPWMVGAVHHRGSVLTVIDFPRLWGAEAFGISDLRTYFVLTDGRARVGVLVETLHGVTELDAAPIPYRGIDRLGITDVARHRDQTVLVLSAAVLFQDGRFGEQG